jgi:hypothetical protein
VGISSFTALVFADDELMLKQRRGFASNGADLHGKRLTQFGLVIVQPACLQLVAGVARLFGSQTLATMTAARRFSSRTTRGPYLERGEGWCRLLGCTVA